MFAFALRASEIVKQQILYKYLLKKMCIHIFSFHVSYKYVYFMNTHVRTFY